SAPGGCYRRACACVASMPWPPCPLRARRAGWRRRGSACLRGSAAAAVAARSPLHRARAPGIKHLAHLAVDDALLVAAARVASDHAAPEVHGVGIAQVLGDLPASREAAQDQLHGGLADSQPAPRARYEKLRHAVVD